MFGLEDQAAHTQKSYHNHSQYQS